MDSQPVQLTHILVAKHDKNRTTAWRVSCEKCGGLLISKSRSGAIRVAQGHGEDIHDRKVIVKIQG